MLWLILSVLTGHSDMFDFFFTIKVSDVLRAQLNCLWSVINYVSDGKWQDNKYLLFEVRREMQNTSHRGAKLRSQTGSSCWAGPPHVRWQQPGPEGPGAAEASKATQKCSEEKCALHLHLHSSFPTCKEQHRQTGDGRGAWHHLVLHLR